MRKFLLGLAHVLKWIPAAALVVGVIGFLVVLWTIEPMALVAIAAVVVVIGGGTWGVYYTDKHDGGRP